MKIRMYKGGLAESLETMKEIEPTIPAILSYLGEETGEVQVQPYVTTPDLRINWNQTYLVLFNGELRAFSDGALT